MISIPSTVYEISRNTFRNTGLSHVELGSGIRNLGPSCFCDTKLTEVKLPENLEAIRSFLFRNTSIESISVPAGVKRIMTGSFSYMQCLKTLTIEDCEETLEFDIVANLKQGRNPWIGHSQDTDFLGLWFYKSIFITDLYYGRNTATWLPAGWVNSPSEALFGDLYPDGIVIENPFEELSTLKNIIVGPLVTDASQLTFTNYPDLETVTFLSTVPPMLSSLSPQQAESVVVTVPAGCVDAYRKIPGWADVKNYREAGGSSEEASSAFCLSDTMIELTQGETKQLTIDVTGIKIGKSTLTVTLTDENGEEETAICEIIVVEEEADIAEIFNDEVAKTVDIYNLSGVLLKSDVAPEAVLDFPAGIYIVGGKKILVK